MFADFCRMSETESEDPAFQWNFELPQFDNLWEQVAAAMPPIFPPPPPIEPWWL